jgi:hypothetical protein
MQANGRWFSDVETADHSRQASRDATAVTHLFERHPLCEHCRIPPTWVLRRVSERTVALCAGCDFRLRSTDTRSRIEAARNLRDLESLERGL